MTFSKKLSAELAAYDKIHNAALPNNTSATTDAFLCDGSRLGLEIVGELSAAVTIPEDKVLTVELQDCASKGGVYAKAATLFSSGAGSVAAGEIFRFAPVSNMKTWKKIKITDTANLSAAKLSIRLAHIAG